MADISVYVPNDTNCTGYVDVDEDLPPDTLVGSGGSTEYDAGERDDVSVDNTDYVNAAGAYRMHRLKFTIAEAEGDVTQLDPSTIIRGDGPVWGGPVVLYIWNDTDTQWTEVARDDTPASSTDIELTDSITADITKYINASSEVFVMVMTGVGVKKNLYLDRGQLTVTYTAAAPEITMTGNGQNIANGDVTPREADHTDFGTAVENQGTVVRTYTIGNTGDANLVLDGTPIVAISGADAGQFAVTEQPASPIAPAGHDTFDVTFTPTSVGLKEATLSIDNDDADEDPFTFAIQGTGTDSSPGGTAGLLLMARYRGRLVR